mgnify:FL=1
MEENTIADKDSEMKIKSSESTDRDWLEETRVYPNGSRTLVEKQYESGGFGQENKSTREGQNVKMGQDHKSDSDDEPTEEPVAENQRQRYPLNERRAPR